MSPDITSRPIALVGLMGVGKTTVGRRLAKKLDRAFSIVMMKLKKRQAELSPDIFAITEKTPLETANGALSTVF